MIKIFPSHTALLVRSVERAAALLAPHGFQIGPTEAWEGEGTKEIYVQRDYANSLLLMEPVKPGAYQRAMDKRGPGIHHFAIDILSLEEFLRSISGSGWLLHPMSIETIKRGKTAYLARPGFPALIEVQERELLSERPLFVQKVEMAIPSGLGKLLPAIGLEQIVQPTANMASIQLGLAKVALKELIA